jgi:hypothetical protein
VTAGSRSARGVLFYTEYPGNSIGEVLPPGYASDYKTVGLTALGVASSVEMTDNKSLAPKERKRPH